MIPYQTRASLLQMEPSLDVNWEGSLSQIFEESNIEVREEIDRQILKPKDIQWNRVNNTFEYSVTNSLAILKHSFSNERMRSIATKLSQSIQQFCLHRAGCDKAVLSMQRCEQRSERLTQPVCREFLQLFAVKKLREKDLKLNKRQKHKG